MIHKPSQLLDCAQPFFCLALNSAGFEYHSWSPQSSSSCHNVGQVLWSENLWSVSVFDPTWPDFVIDLTNQKWYRPGALHVFNKFKKMVKSSQEVTSDYQRCKNRVTGGVWEYSTWKCRVIPRMIHTNPVHICAFWSVIKSPLQSELKFEITATGGSVNCTIWLLVCKVLISVWFVDLTRLRFSLNLVHQTTWDILRRIPTINRWR